jgi:putative FmdB family regulatory protein
MGSSLPCAPEAYCHACYNLISKFSEETSVPLYEYACLKCDRHTDKIEPVAGPHLKKCPHCGGKVESVITAPSIKFKGSGWYVTDYAAKSNTSEEKKSDGSAGNSSDSKEPSSKDSGSKESGSKESSSKDSSAKDGRSKESSSSKESKEKKPPGAKKD